MNLVKVETVFGGCPSFFRRCVEESKRSRDGYRIAGYHLAQNLRRLIHDEVDPEIEREIDDHVQRDDFDGAWDWLRRTLPKCMTLVPLRRKGTFLRGFWTAYGGR